MREKRSRYLYKWHTAYGGSLDEWGYGIATVKDERLYVLGRSSVQFHSPRGHSPEFGWQEGGVNDLLLMRLNPATGNFIWHGFFGSPQVESVGGMELDPDGNPCISGTARGELIENDLEGPLHEYTGSEADILVIKTPG